MADISKITVEGVTYDIKDDVARSQSVTSVNGQTGTVVLDADDVGAMPDDYVAPVTSVNGMTGDVVVGGGGGSYTATAPISIDADNDISHDASGVTAGTYYPNSEGKGSWDFPSLTVDAKGHITSANNFGVIIPNAKDDSTSRGGLITQTQYDKFANAHDLYAPHVAVMTINAGTTSKSLTITPYSTYVKTQGQYVRILGLWSYINPTYEPCVVDYSFSASPNLSASVTVTASIASAYTNNITIFVLYCNGGAM